MATVVSGGKWFACGCCDPGETPSQCFVHRETVKGLQGQKWIKIGCSLWKLRDLVGITMKNMAYI